jgi:hypothetical protein
MMRAGGPLRSCPVAWCNSTARTGRAKPGPGGDQEIDLYVALPEGAYLDGTTAGLATVIRSWIDRGAIAEALGLPHEHQVLLSQTVGRPKAAGRAGTLKA